MSAQEPCVSFTRMQDGSAADYALLERLERDHVKRLPERILEHLRRLEHSLSGYRISRLEHSLQTATRALRDGADTDWIVAALLHDIGDDLAPHNHDSFAAEILRPYLREDCVWVVRHHGNFQLAYYGDKVGADPEARRKYIDDPRYEAAVVFCERWDQTSFDPGYDTEPLASFEPLVHEVFSRPPWDARFQRPGERVPPVASPRAQGTSATN